MRRRTTNSSRATIDGVTDLDWSGVTTRTVHLSLPPNRPATGAPLITGQATVGQELAVDVTGIEDEDGLHDIEYTYQWVRVDADGTSNEEDITDATADTYTLTDGDLGKKVKIEVSFSDDFGSDEQRTSAPTDTVTAVAMTTPGVTVSTTALTVTEEDTTGDSYTVVLNTQPTANVTVTVAGHAGTDVTPSPTSLTSRRRPGHGPDGDGDGRRRCGHGERCGHADPQRGEHGHRTMTASRSTAWR